MPEPQREVASARGPAAGQQQESTFRKFLGVAQARPSQTSIDILLRLTRLVQQQMFFMWALMQLGTKFLQEMSFFYSHIMSKATRFFGSSPERTTTSQSNDPKPPANPLALPPKEVSLAWQLGQPLDMHVRLTTAPPAQVFNMPNWLKEQDKGLPKFVWSNITFGDWDTAYTAEFDVKFPKVRVHSWQCYCRAERLCYLLHILYLTECVE